MGARRIKRVWQLVRALAVSRGGSEVCRRGGEEEEEGFSGSAARRRHTAFFSPQSCEATEREQPSAAAYFVSPDSQRHLHIAINTTDGNLLLGQSSPALAPQHFHVHHSRVTTAFSLTGGLIPGFSKEHQHCLAV